VRLAVILLTILALAGHLSAQSQKSVNLELTKEIREGVDAWPLIAHPKDSIERRVNAALVQLNNDLRKTLDGCDADVAEFNGQSGTAEPGKNSTPDDWSRRIEVTMTGPRFLSMIARDDFFCGGAHPDDNRTVVVFDLQTGEMVDWASFLAKESGATSEKNVLGDAGGTTPPLAFAGLQPLYADAEVDDCKDIFAEPQSFLLWPDAKSGTLVAEVTGLSHVGAPCKVDFKMRLDQARKLGFDETLLGAIALAHLQFAKGSH